MLIRLKVTVNGKQMRMENKVKRFEGEGEKSGRVGE